MTKWADEYTAHPLWGVVDKVDEQLGGVTAPEDANQREEIQRVRGIVERLIEHKGTTHPEAYSLGMLSAAQTQLETAVQAPLTQYLADPVAQVPTLTQVARGGVDAVVEQLARWPRLDPRGMAQSAGRANAKANTALEKLITVLTARATQLEADQKKLEAKWKTAEGELADRQVALDEEQKAAVATQTEATIASLKNTSELTAVEAEAVLSVMRESQKQVEEIEKRTGSTASAYARRVVADSFSRYAMSSAFAGWFWDVVGVTLGVIAVWKLTDFLSDITTAVGDIEGTAVAMRIGITVATTVVAGYAFHIARPYHATKRAAKRADLRLRTIHAFIANQPEKTQESLLFELAKKLYVDGEMLEEPVTTRTGRRARAERFLKIEANKKDGATPAE